MTTDIQQENRLAGRMAGVLYLAGGITVAGLPALPGGHAQHWGLLVGIAAGCLLWGALCIFVIDLGTAPRAAFLVPAGVGLAASAGVIAATGGVTSPARFYLFFIVVYVASFFSPREAYPYLAGAALVHATPLFYDSGATGAQYVGELSVVVPAYILLGVVIMRGKKLLMDLRAEAQFLALTDPLTELPNRRAMLDWLRARLEQSNDEEERTIGLVLLDLDGFKDVNTLHGYPEGDRVLCETARMLETCIREDDLVARLGGDEFAVLAPHTDEEGMRGLAERILDCTRGIEARLELAGVLLTASVGWVMYPKDADEIDDLIAAADFCMRNAKATGKDRAISTLDPLVALPVAN